MPYVSAAFFILIPLSTAIMPCRNWSLLQLPFFFNFSLLLLNLVLCMCSPPRSLFVMSCKTCLTYDELRARSPGTASPLTFLREPLLCCRRGGGAVSCQGEWIRVQMHPPIQEPPPCCWLRGCFFSDRKSRPCWKGVAPTPLLMLTVPPSPHTSAMTLR
jgi:hypothetical protein